MSTGDKWFRPYANKPGRSTPAPSTLRVLYTFVSSKSASHLHLGNFQHSPDAQPLKRVPKPITAGLLVTRAGPRPRHAFLSPPALVGLSTWHRRSASACAFRPCMKPFVNHSGTPRHLGRTVETGSFGKLKLGFTPSSVLESHCV